MTHRPAPSWRSFTLALALLALAPVPGCFGADPAPQAVAGFTAYTRTVEARLDRQHQSSDSFLAPEDPRRLRHGDLIIEQIPSESGADLPGALIHHWRGTAFAPGATAADFERLMKDFATYPQRFSPQVLQATVLSQSADHAQATMRVRQQHILTVVLDTTYDITYGRLDPQHGFILSRSTPVSEIGSNGKPLAPGEEHGFLWLMNTYWSYEEGDGGLYMQIETVSLTRSIPAGLGWAIGPFVESVPRESLEFTLRCVVNGLRK